jgi:tight adherence protein B
MSGFSLIYVIYGAAALSGIMIAEAAYLLYAGRTDRRASINRRMKLHDNKISQEQVLVQLRKERGLENGASRFSFERFRALRTQSGLITPMPRFLMLTSGVALGLVLFAMWYGLPLLFGAIALVPLAAQG